MRKKIAENLFSIVKGKANDKLFIKEKKDNIVILFDLHLGDGVMTLNFVNKLIVDRKSKGYNEFIIICNNTLVSIFKKALVSNYNIKYVVIDELKALSAFKMDRKAKQFICDELIVPYGNPITLRLAMLIPTKHRYIMIHENVVRTNIRRNIIGARCEVLLEWNSRKKMLLEIYKDFAKELNIKYFRSEILYIDNDTLTSKNEINYCVFSVGSTDSNRNWGIEKFIDVILHILDTTNFDIVIAGDNNDLQLAEIIIKRVNDNRIKNFVGCTSIVELISLLKDSEFLVANDTGIVHLAIVLGIDVVFIGTRQNKRCLPYKLDIAEKQKIIGIWNTENLQCDLCEIPTNDKILNQIPNVMCRKSLIENGCYYCIQSIDSNSVCDRIDSLLGAEYENNNES